MEEMSQRPLREIKEMEHRSYLTQRSAWTRNKSGELVLTGPHAEDSSINIVSDFFIPWYIISPNSHPYSDTTPGGITLKFQAGSQSDHAVAINCHVGALKAYFNQEEKIQKFKTVALNKLKFHPNTGREVLSWIYCRRSCFCSKDEVDNVLELADQLGIHDLRDAIMGNHLKEIMTDLSSPIMCTFQCANIDYRSHSQLRLGFHLSGDSCYHIQQHDLQENLIYTITAPNSREKLSHSFHAFLDYMHTISKNSLELYEIRSSQTNSDIQKRLCNSFLYKPNQFRLQILTKNHEGIKEAIARTSEEVVYSFSVEKPGFFFNILEIQPYFTFSCATHKGLLNFMGEYSIDNPTGYALEIRKPELHTLQKLMGAVNLMGFSPLDSVLYVVQPDRLGMLNVMEKLQDSSEPSPPLPDLKIVEVSDPGPRHVPN